MKIGFSKTFCLVVLVFLGSAPSSVSSVELVLYQDYGYGRARRHLKSAVDNFEDIYFNDMVSSIWAMEGDWELYGDAYYEGPRMTIREGEAGSVNINDYYSSARPTCKYVADPSRFKLTVFWDGDFQGKSRVFTDATPYVGDDWNNKISSVHADKGDWEIYANVSYNGVRMTISEGQWKNIRDFKWGWDDTATSLRPLCSTYREKAACQLTEIEIMDDGRRAIYDGTQIIGSAWDGTCTAPSGSTLRLSIGNTDTVQESFTLTTSEQYETNWFASATVTVSADFTFFGFGTKISAAVSGGGGGSHTMGKSESKSFASSVATTTGSSITWTPPGSALIFGVVDRWTLDLSAAPVKMHMTCPWDGSEKIVDTTMRLKSTTFQTARFYPFVGSYTAAACAADPAIHFCTQEVQNKYFHELRDFRKIYNEVYEAFQACFANEKGKVSVGEPTWEILFGLPHSVQLDHDCVSPPQGE